MPISLTLGQASSQLASIPACDLVVEKDVPLARRTTFRIGGSAGLLVRCRSVQGVIEALRAARSCAAPWLVLGRGANVLVPDQGLEAMVLTLEGGLAVLERRGEKLLAGGGASLGRAVRETMDAGLAGLECLGGIPSSIGGALAGNAGAQGQEILAVLAWAEVVEADGAVRRIPRSEVAGGYRWSVLGQGRVVTEAELALRPDDPALLQERARQAREWRRRALPPGPSAGSIFRNPAGDFAGRLLEQAGCKGLQSGGATVSQRHANIIVNSGGARALDVRALIAEMARRVREGFGVCLELEVKVLAPNGSVIVDPEGFWVAEVEP